LQKRIEINPNGASFDFTYNNAFENLNKINSAKINNNRNEIEYKLI
jgi:hypothetical protein